MENQIRHPTREFKERSSPPGASGKEYPRENCFLHIGSGAKIINGWVNIDLQAHPGVDLVADATEVLEFSNVRAVYAEHFIEHLLLDKSLAFLLEVHRVLGRSGWLRLSTPNLEWVWKTHYLFDRSDKDKCVYTLGANRAFKGWGHEFIWSPPLLKEALASCGYRKLRWCNYGESKKKFFRNIEQHENSPDLPGIPHVIIIEGKKGPLQPQRLAEFNQLLLKHFLGLWS
jgi:hypothetical protein